MYLTCWPVDHLMLGGTTPIEAIRIKLDLDTIKHSESEPGRPLHSFDNAVDTEMTMHNKVWAF